MLAAASCFSRSLFSLRKGYAATNLRLRHAATRCMPPRDSTAPLTFPEGLARAVKLRAELWALVDALPSLAMPTDDAAALPSLGGDAAVRLEDVEALIEIKEDLDRVSGKWKSFTAELAALDAYRMALAERLPPAQHLRMLLKLASRTGGWARPMSTLTEPLQSLLASPAAAAQDISAAWQLVRRGRLSLPVSAASAAFIRHVLADVSDPRHPPEQKEKDSGKHPRITPGESFLVQLAFSNTDAGTDAAIALRLAEECSPRLSYQPSATPVRLEGELLGQLHAGLPARQLSPAVRFRRDIGIIFNDVRDYCYRYDPTKLLLPGVYCDGKSAISVELPHLTYALVERVEVDVDTHHVLYNEEDDARVRGVSPGTDVILEPYGDPPSLSPPPPLSSEISPPPKTLTKTLKPAAQAVPCTHVTISLSESTTVQAVRVYGRAITW